MLRILMAFNWALPAMAADYGSPEAISALRRDVPLLLAAGLKSQRLQPHIDSIFADRSEAVIVWHAARNRGVIVMRYVRQRWWWRAGSTTTDDRGYQYWSRLGSPGDNLNGCNAIVRHSPSTKDLQEAGFITPTFAALLSKRLPTWRTRAAHLPLVICDRMAQVAWGDGYDATFRATSSNAWGPFRGSRPKIDRMPPEYYRFTISANSVASVAVESNSTLDVWFPFVLDTKDTYALHLIGVEPAIDGVAGKLEDNTLHFVLPAFTVPEGSSAEGAIVGIADTPT